MADEKQETINEIWLLWDRKGSNPIPFSSRDAVATYAKRWLEAALGKKAAKEEIVVRESPNKDDISFIQKPGIQLLHAYKEKLHHSADDLEQRKDYPKIVL